jgi:hypothetical protein
MKNTIVNTDANRLRRLPISTFSLNNSMAETDEITMIYPINSYSINPIK